MPSFTGEQETTHINEQNKSRDSNSPTSKFPEIIYLNIAAYHLYHQNVMGEITVRPPFLKTYSKIR